jgi:hypothetical protein
VPQRKSGELVVDPLDFGDDLVFDGAGHTYILMRSLRGS